MKTTILEKILSFKANGTNSRNRVSWRRGFLFISLLSVCFALWPTAQVASQDGPAVPRAPQEAPMGPENPEGAAPAAPLAALPGYNTADGDQALFNVSTGTGNSAFGWRALFSNTDASFNTGVGGGALVLNIGNSNTAVGAAALLLNTSGTENTAVGTDALVFNDTGNLNTAVGAFALFDNVTGVENTAVGAQALPNSTASDNTAVGLFALLNAVGGGSNTACGVAALRDNVSGINNCALGRGALRFNEGSGNIAIGREAATTPPSTGQYNNSILIGTLGDSNAIDPDGRTYIGGIRGVAVGNADGINVIVDSDGQLGTTNSSRRFKNDIKPMDQTSEAILKLKPVTFHYKNGDTKKAENTPQFGLIAEDVEQVNRDLVVYGKDGKIWSVRYDAVNAMLLNEFLKEHKRVEAQQHNIADLKSTVALQRKEMQVLTAQLKEQASQIQQVSAQLELNKSAARTVAIDR